MDRQVRNIRYMLLSLLESFVEATASSERVMVTSGRVVCDAFGRVVATKLPGAALVHSNVVIDTMSIS